MGNINQYERKEWSQWGEDGIIQHLFDVIDTTNKRCVEFGFWPNESNTHILIGHHGWTGLLIDDSWIHVTRAREQYAHFDATLVTARLTAENINDVMRDAGFTGSIDLLSIDVDGIDYYLWEALTVIDPRVVIIEYNASMGPYESVTIRYDPTFNRLQSGCDPIYHGASLQALTKLAHRKGYFLVGCESHGINAFYVKTPLKPLLQEVSVEEAFHPIFCRKPWPQLIEVIRKCGLQSV